MNSLIILCAKDLLYLAALLGLIYWLFLANKQKKYLIIFGAITGIVAFILAKVGSTLFYNARPFVSEHLTPLIQHATDNGFPSDHTLLAASIAVTVFAVSKKWGIGFMVLAIIIGASRVMAHVHHPIDIIGSLVFSFIGGMVAYFLAPKVEKLFHKPHHEEA
ncbi:MAG TPA: phosphatase PAP2 family protein [Candidatus Microsaccharimonas sp.]|jgi:undecaprenyl-diphosphatase